MRRSPVTIRDLTEGILLRRSFFRYTRRSLKAVDSTLTWGSYSIANSRTRSALKVEKSKLDITIFRSYSRLSYELIVRYIFIGCHGRATHTQRLVVVFNKFDTGEKGKLSREPGRNTRLLSLVARSTGLTRVTSEKGLALHKG